MSKRMEINLVKEEPPNHTYLIEIKTFYLIFRGNFKKQHPLDLDEFKGNFLKPPWVYPFFPGSWDFPI